MTYMTKAVLGITFVIVGIAFAGMAEELLKPFIKDANKRRYWSYVVGALWPVALWFLILAYFGLLLLSLIGDFLGVDRDNLPNTI